MGKLREETTTIDSELYLEKIVHISLGTNWWLKWKQAEKIILGELEAFSEKSLFFGR